MTTQYRAVRQSDGDYVIQTSPMGTNWEHLCYVRGCNVGRMLNRLNASAFYRELDEANQRARLAMAKEGGR